MRNRQLFLSFDGFDKIFFTKYCNPKHTPFLYNLNKFQNYSTFKTNLPTFVYPQWGTLHKNKDISDNKIFSLIDLNKKGFFKIFNYENIKSKNIFSDKKKEGFFIYNYFLPLTYPIDQNIFEVSFSDQHLIRNKKPYYAKLNSNKFNYDIFPKSSQFFPEGGFTNKKIIKIFIDKQINFMKNQLKSLKDTVTLNSNEAYFYHIFSTDPFFHSMWHIIDENHKLHDNSYNKEIIKFFKSLDIMISKIFNIIKPDSYILYSLHGFQETKYIISLRHLLDNQNTNYLNSHKYLPNKNKIYKFSLNYLRTIKRYFRNKLFFSSDVFFDVKVVYFKNTYTGKKLLKQFTNNLLNLKSGNYKLFHDYNIYHSDCMKWSIVVPKPNIGVTMRNLMSQNISSPNIYDYLLGTHTNEAIFLTNIKIEKKINNIFSFRKLFFK